MRTRAYEATLETASELDPAKASIFPLVPVPPLRPVSMLKKVAPMAGPRPSCLLHAVSYTRQIQAHFDISHLLKHLELEDKKSVLTFQFTVPASIPTLSNPAVLNLGGCTYSA